MGAFFSQICFLPQQPAEYPASMLFRNLLWRTPRCRTHIKFAGGNGEGWSDAVSDDGDSDHAVTRFAFLHKSIFIFTGCISGDWIRQCPLMW